MLVEAARAASVPPLPSLALLAATRGAATADACPWLTRHGTVRVLARGASATPRQPTLAAIAELDARLLAATPPRDESEKTVLRLLVAALNTRAAGPLTKFELYAVWHALDSAVSAAHAWRRAALRAGAAPPAELDAAHLALALHAADGSAMTVASLRARLRRGAAEGMAATWRATGGYAAGRRG